MAHREAKVIHHVEDAPDTDTKAVVTPAEISRVRWRPERGGCMPQAFTEAEILDVKCYIEGEFFAAGPLEAGPLVDGRIVVSAVTVEVHG